MDAFEKHNIKVGSMLTDNDNTIYRANYFIWSEGITHKYGEPVEDNVVHLDVFEESEDGTLKQVGQKDFVHIKFLNPMPIRQNYLRAVGFQETEHNGKTVLRLKNTYFENLNQNHGVFILRRINDDAVYPLTFMHEVQLAADRL